MRNLVTKSRITFYFGVNAVVLFVMLSLVPSDEAYYRFERLMSHVGPFGSLSQHFRSSPTTIISIILESTQVRFVEVEDIPINLGYAVNPSSQVREVKHFSKVLGEERTYWVYLPPGYEESKETYPALYLLHGMSQNHRWWVEVARIDRIATSMIESGKMRPAIIVMPNGNRVQWNVATTSLYDNRCQTGLDVVARVLTVVGDLFPGIRIYNVSCDGDFENYIVQDMVNEVESKYRTNGESYVGGFSLGARGAVQLALAHDDIFDGAFGLSGNYDYLRNQMSRDDLRVKSSTRLFLSSGTKDQRGVYGDLNTFLFHKDLVRQGIEHQYCTYEGTHNDVGWISVMPYAFQYLLGNPNVSNVTDSCGDDCPDSGDLDSCRSSDQEIVDLTPDSGNLEVAKQNAN